MVRRHLAYLFDQVSTADPGSVLRMNARVATCYAWADAHGFTIVDEIIAWADGSGPVAQVLTDLLALCRQDGAVLLVHSEQVLPTPVGGPPLDGVLVVVAAGCDAASGGEGAGCAWH